MAEKITGYSLIVVGIATMVYSAFNIYQVFTAQAKPVDLFNLPGLSLDLSSLVSENTQPSQNLKTELVSPEVINQPLNLLGHILFMGFILNLGFKISSLGVQLVRPIKVKLKVEEKVKSILESDSSPD